MLNLLLGVGTNIALIVGASCGGLVALILIIASVTYWARRSKRKFLVGTFLAFMD